MQSAQRALIALQLADAAVVRARQLQLEIGANQRALQPARHGQGPMHGTSTLQPYVTWPTLLGNDAERR